MKIVVPLDLSEVAGKAIEPAAQIARALGDELHLITVSGLRLRGDLLAQAKSEEVDVVDLIESYLKSAESDLDGVKTGYSLIKGDDAAEAILDFAEGEEIRMIVMATHGRSGLERWRLGSVAEKVVRHSPVAVTIIPMRGKPWT